MVFSCLVEPLVKPLVGRGTSGPGRRTALRRSRLASTALAVSALMACATAADASLLDGHQKKQSEVRCNAHAKPAPIPSRVELDRLATLRNEDELVAAPALAPDFEWEALSAAHLRHRRDIGLDTGSGLGLGKRLDRLLSPVESTFVLFSSGQHQSGAPNPAI